MRKLLIFSAIVSCFMCNSFVQAQTYTSIHTLGKIPLIKAKGTGVLDLTELTKSNPHLAFSVKDPKSGEISYTHNSLFYGKNDGYYYQGQKRLQGYPVSTDITSADCKITDIKSPPEELPPLATTTVEYMGNLNASDAIPVVTPFNPSNPVSYNYTSTAGIYDSLGISHQLSVYYIKDKANSWMIAVYVDGNSIGSGNITFNTSGVFVSATGMNALSFNPGNGAKSPQAISLHFTGFTQYGNPYSINSPLVDGMPAGIYSSNMVDDNGYISFNYSNGQSITFSKVAVFIQE